MNDHLTKGATQQTLLQPDDPWIKKDSDVKPYILKTFGQHQTTRITVHCHIHNEL